MKNYLLKQFSIFTAVVIFFSAFTNQALAIQLGSSYMVETATSLAQIISMWSVISLFFITFLKNIVAWLRGRKTKRWLNIMLISLTVIASLLFVYFVDPGNYPTQQTVIFGGALGFFITMITFTVKSFSKRKHGLTLTPKANFILLGIALFFCAATCAFILGV